MTIDCVELLAFKVNCPGFGTFGFVDRFNEALRWCHERHGEDAGCMYLHNGDGGGTTYAPVGVVWAQFLSYFYFLRQEDAIEFKLRWG